MASISHNILRNSKTIAVVFILLSQLDASVQAQVLYECKSPSGDTITYVLGTHHYLPSSQYSFPSLASSLIAISDIVFLENDSRSTAEDRQKLNADFKSVIVPFEKGKTLGNFLSKKQMAEVTAFYSKNFGLSKKQVASKLHLRPFYMHNYLTTQDTSFRSVDNLAMEKAYEYEKPVISLDEADNLRVTYTWLAHSMSPDSLYHLIKTYDTPRDPVIDLDEAYLNRDTSQLRLYMDSFTPEARDVLLTTRNRKWEKILLQQSRKVNFVAVGSAHLLDYDGLLEFYRGRGYRVRGIVVE